MFNGHMMNYEGFFSIQVQMVQYLIFFKRLNYLNSSQYNTFLFNTKL